MKDIEFLMFAGSLFLSILIFIVTLSLMLILIHLIVQLDENVIAPFIDKINPFKKG